MDFDRVDVVSIFIVRKRSIFLDGGRVVSDEDFKRIRTIFE